MVNDKATIQKLISEKKETECVDFKEKIYSSWRDSDFIKDITAFANGEAYGDKYLIFGVNDMEHKVLGINPEKIPDPSELENCIVERIEPRLKIQCGIVIIDNKTLFYIKVSVENNNPPYIVKVDSHNYKQGDIFIRVGTCNRKATRLDIDAMYKRNLSASIKLFSDSVLISPISMPNELIKEPTYGMVEVEMINPAGQPLLFCGGYILISNNRCNIKRKILRINPRYSLDDVPYCLSANCREKKTLLFDFSSQDCIDLGFEETGVLCIDTIIQVVLYDTDNQEYTTNTMPALLIAKGDVLWKVKQLNHPKHSRKKKTE